MEPPVSGEASAPQLDPLFEPSKADDLSSQGMRLLIGLLGLALPVLAWVVAGVRPTQGLDRWRLLGSISAYYYTGATAAFVGILGALAAFLLTYRGFDNEDRKYDRLASIVAGVAAAVVAAFPTAPPAPLTPPSWWRPATQTFHLTAAVVLFLSFIAFAVYLFPKSHYKKGERLPHDLWLRNVTCYTCGAGMALCVIWAGIAMLLHAPIFWPEALALELFAVSWLAKGRLDKTGRAVRQRVSYYALNPSQMVPGMRPPQEDVTGESR